MVTCCFCSRTLVPALNLSQGCVRSGHHLHMSPSFLFCSLFLSHSCYLSLSLFPSGSIYSSVHSFIFIIHAEWSDSGSLNAHEYLWDETLIKLFVLLRTMTAAEWLPCWAELVTGLMVYTFMIAAPAWSLIHILQPYSHPPLCLVQTLPKDGFLNGYGCHAGCADQSCLMQWTQQGPNLFLRLHVSV